MTQDYDSLAVEQVAEDRESAQDLVRFLGNFIARPPGEALPDQLASAALGRDALLKALIG